MPSTTVPLGRVAELKVLASPVARSVYSIPSRTKLLCSERYTFFLSSMSFLLFVVRLCLSSFAGARAPARRPYLMATASFLSFR